MKGICPMCRSVQKIVFAPVSEDAPEEKKDWGLMKNYILVEHEIPGVPGAWCPGAYETPIGWDGVKLDKLV